MTRKQDLLAYILASNKKWKDSTLKLFKKNLFEGNKAHRKVKI